MRNKKFITIVQMKEEKQINGSSNGWKVKKLGELCKPKEGLRRGPFGSAIKKDFFVPDGYKVYEQSNAIYDDVERGKYFIDHTKYQELINFDVKPGDLIVSCSGTLGRIAEIPLKAKPGVINQALLRIRLLDDVVTKKYFLYYFRSASFQKKIFDQSQGTAMSNLIGIKDFKEIELHIPSLNVQNQIVYKIEELFSELDKGIEELKTAQQQLKVYRQAVLKWAFEGRLTNEVVKEGVLPEGWEFSQLGKLIEQPKYGTSKKCNYKKIGKGVLRIPNIKDGKVDDSDLKYAEFDNDEIETYRLKVGDLLTIRSNGSVDIVGQCALISNQNIGYLYAGYLIRLRPLQSLINPRYLLHVISSSNLRNQIESKAKSTSGVNNINSDELKSLIVPICSMEEQQQIVQEIESRLSVCDKIEETITNSLKQAEALRQSILKKAFEGALYNYV